MDKAVPRTAVANQSLYVNRAYSQGDYECGDDCISLDLHASAVTTVTLKKKRNMRAFRASWCRQLTSASFKDMPALEVVDISMCKYLETVSFKSCHKLRTLDVSGTSIKSLKGINSIECIISGFFPFVFGGSQRFPNLLFLNATVGDLRFKNYPALEVLSVKSDIPLKLSVISAHPSLRVVSLEGTGYIIDSVAPSTKLRVIEGYIAQEKSAQDTSNLLKEAGIYAVFREIDESGAKFDPAMLDGLKAIGLVKGHIDDMVNEGIAGLFMPHGLGHNMGIDVHDMEDLGEDLVGYDDDQTRASQLGLGSLRMARRLRPGHVITDEPGIYFIPALIGKWKTEGTDKGMVDYGAIEQYLDFGGIRLEDDLLITEDGCRRLGPHRLPIAADDVEAAMANE